MTTSRPTDRHSPVKSDSHDQLEEEGEIMYGKNESILEFKPTGEDLPPSLSKDSDNDDDSLQEEEKIIKLPSSKNKNVAKKDLKKQDKKKETIREQVSSFIGKGRISKFLKKNNDKKQQSNKPSTQNSKKQKTQPTPDITEQKNVTVIIPNPEQENDSELQQQNLLKVTFKDEFDDSESNVNWGEVFSLRTIKTSSSDADDISVKTEDIYKDDEVREHFPGKISFDDLTVNASMQTVHPKQKMPPHSQASRIGHAIHNQVITRNSFAKTRWENSFVGLTLKSCACAVLATNLLSSQTFQTLTLLKFSKLSSVSNIVTFLTTCPNITRLSFSNAIVVQKGLFNEGDFEMMELLNLKQIEIVNWILCLTKNEYWLVNFFTKAVTLGNLESFILRGTEGMLTEKKSKHYRKVMAEITTDPCIVSKFLLKNQASLKSAPMGGLGFSLMQPMDISKFHTLQSVQFQSLKINLSSDGLQMILRSQNKLKCVTCSGFIERLDDRLKGCINTTIENNLATLTTIGLFPTIIRESNFNLTHAAAYTFNCEVFQRCRKLESLFINVTMASEAFSQRKSAGRLQNIHLLPTTLVHMELYNHEFDFHELNLLGIRYSKFVNLKSLVLSANSSKLYIVYLLWIKNLFALPHFFTADFFGGKLESVEIFKNYIVTQPTGSIAMTKISDCLSFYKSSRSDRPNKISQHHNLVLNEPSHNTLH